MPTDLARICFVAPNAYPVLAGNSDLPVIGGAEVQQVLVARGLVARGYQVSMICLDFGQDAIVDVHGVRVFRAFRPGAGLPVVRFIWPRTTSLWHCMKQADADIYYQRAAGMVTGLTAAFCRRNHRKSIYAAAGTPSLQRNTEKIRYRRDRYLYEYGLKRVDRILVQNQEQAELCRQNFDRGTTLVLNCYPAPLRRTSAKSKTILWVSTIRDVKRPWIFLDLAAAHPEYQFRMIGGPEIGDDSLYRSIEAKARQLVNMEFLGFVPYSMIDQHFDEAAILVNTSESEGFPNAFLQAWARGTPSVSFIDSGARLGEAHVGWIVETVDQMTTTLKEAMTNDMKRIEEGERCRQYYERNHTPERILDQYEQIFAEMLTARS